VYAAEGTLQVGATDGWARLQIESGDRLVLTGMTAAVDLSLMTVTFLQPTQGVTNWFLESDSGLSGAFQEVHYATGLSGVLVAEPNRYGAAIVPEPALSALCLLLTLWVPGAKFKVKR